MVKCVDVLIVGAGLAGLVAAQRLQMSLPQASVLILEKEEAVGGRLATLPLGLGQGDAGAQFFTVRTAVFQAIVDDWLARDVVFKWSHGWADGSLASVAKRDGYPRYAGRQGMAGLAHDLAAKVDLLVGKEVVGITAVNHDWQIQTNRGNAFQSRYLILTAPIPQSLHLLAQNEIQLSLQDQAALATAQYAPCLCGLFEIDGAVNLPEPGALQRPGHPFSWIADNQRKGISAGAQIVTVHMDGQRSQEMWLTPDEAILAKIVAELTQFLAPNAAIQRAYLKRWPYASLNAVYPEHFLRTEGRPALYFAGDGLGGPRVEGAVLSGLAVAEAIKLDTNSRGRDEL